MKNNKSPKQDELVLESIKEGPKIIKAAMLLVNKCIQEGITPSQ